MLETIPHLSFLSISWLMVTLAACHQNSNPKFHEIFLLRFSVSKMSTMEKQTPVLCLSKNAFSKERNASGSLWIAESFSAFPKILNRYYVKIFSVLSSWLKFPGIHLLRAIFRPGSRFQSSLWNLDFHSWSSSWKQVPECMGSMGRKKYVHAMKFPSTFFDGEVKEPEPNRNSILG